MEKGSFDLAGRTAIVTGGSRGIGRSIALALAAAGADLVLAARVAHDLDAAAEEVRALGGRVLTVPTDVSKSDQVNAMVEQAIAAYGHIDILVNNAGITQPKPFLEMSDEEVLFVINTNLNSQLWCARAVGRHMKERHCGKIINTASTWGVVARAENVVYCVTKGGVVQLTKGLALEWARYGICVNAIAPGVVRSSRSAKRFDDPEIRAAIVRHIPLRRIAEPDDIAPLAVYLASSASDFMTGSVLLIDGGQLAGYDHWGS